ncbi:2-phospho-L-lactate guanylyltransferase [Naumannella halotolerans]|uniref:2-phospho-L-lactate guanylyltransferase n=1 Tax=Naumannella halotolerans TaxID=993414 RepID=UPI00370D8875
MPDPRPLSDRTAGQVRRPLGAVVALKSLHLAKSRIDAEVGFRRELAWSMLVDTVTALQAVIPVVVVVGDGLPPVGSAQLVPDPGRDLNAAFTAGAAHLLDHGITEVLASVADLPALRSASVDQFVGALPQQRRLFLRDAAGFGTTMLLARALRGPRDLDPRFEGRSADNHLRSGAADPAPENWPDARLDVDTLDDLRRAAGMGLGTRTEALLRDVDHH